jgi:hypothetical protein
MVAWKVPERNAEALSLMTRSSVQPRAARSAATCRASWLVQVADGLRRVTCKVAQVEAEATSMAVSCQTVPLVPDSPADTAAIELDQLTWMVDLQMSRRGGAGRCGSGGAA